MTLFVVQPVLIVPGGVAPDTDPDALRLAIPRLQQWWFDKGVPVLFLDPVTPACEEDWAWFQGHPLGGPFYGVQSWVIDHGLRPQLPDGDYVRVLVILDGYPEGHGESGPTVAVAGYGAVADLASDDYQRRNRACGLLSHEMGHLMGLNHIDDAPHELMASQAWWREWPDCALSVKP